jgi:hypothetical protein
LPARNAYRVGTHIIRTPAPVTGTEPTSCAPRATRLASVLTRNSDSPARETASALSAACAATSEGPPNSSAAISAMFVLLLMSSLMPWSG